MAIWLQITDHHSRNGCKYHRNWGRRIKWEAEGVFSVKWAFWSEASHNWFLWSFWSIHYFGLIQEYKNNTRKLAAICNFCEIYFTLPHYAVCYLCKNVVIICHYRHYGVILIWFQLVFPLGKLGYFLPTFQSLYQCRFAQVTFVLMIFIYLNSFDLSKSLV